MFRLASYSAWANQVKPPAFRQVFIPASFYLFLHKQTALTDKQQAFMGKPKNIVENPSI